MRPDHQWKVDCNAILSQLKKLATKKDVERAVETLSALISKPQKPRVRFDWVIGMARTKTQTKEPRQMEVKITNEQEVDVTITPKTDTGKPAKLDGSPSVTVVSGNSTVKQSEDGLTLTLRSADDPGDTEFLVKADADLGEGIEEISEIIKLSVIGATAKNLGLVAGAPRAKQEIV